MDTLTRMWIAFTATWPIWLCITVLFAYAMWACWENDRTKKAWRRNGGLR